MSNIELLEMIAAKVTAIRNEINDLGVEINEDVNFWRVHDAIVSMVSDLEGVTDTAIRTAEDIEFSPTDHKSKNKSMKQRIKCLADDIELKGKKRKAFIAEMKSAVALMRDNDYDQFYAVADVIMQKYN